MDNVYATKPKAKLELADKEIKTYVSLLEKELQHWLVMKTISQSLEQKLLNKENELKCLRDQTKHNNPNNKQQQEEINTNLKVENTCLMIENNKLKQQIFMLQNEVQRQKNAYSMRIPISAPTSNTNPIKTTSSVNITDNKDPNATSVLVKGFTEEQLYKQLKINITNLGRQMNLKISNYDIINVTRKESKYYERHNLKPNKVILIVHFRTAELKIEFLKNKEKLKAHLNTSELEISDYVSDEVYNLYEYAKMLKTCGYAQIYWRNNCVYAKRTRSTHCDPVLIKTKNDVDVLKASMK